MRRLAPEQIARRFNDLMEMGRARLPGLAPEWTDHNAHDPGITLMELLAWITEAQLYSIGRTRRDERAAFAALFGLEPSGTRPARGLIWPDRLDNRAPGAAFSQSRVIPADAIVRLLEREEPVFRPEGKFLWVPGRLRRLAARLANGREVDYTVINERGGSAFEPFDTEPKRDHALVMEFECASDTGLFPPKRADAENALWPIGVRADKPLTPSAPQPDTRFGPASPASTVPSLAATLITPSDRVPLRIASDSTEGLLRTGTLLLDLAAVKGSPRRVTIELRAPRGFERPPRLLRIEPNVIPIVQSHTVPAEAHDATGVPGLTFQLEIPGLQFAPPEAPLQLQVDDGGKTSWQRCERLSDAGPDDLVYEFDSDTGRVTFGNGVNGRIPPSGAKIFVSYAVCSGERGDVAANRKWRVSGFAGAFGVNLDAVSGGAESIRSIDARREARRRAREDHALVSAEDIRSAALALPLLEVTRAWVLRPNDKLPRTGTVTLVAMRARRSEEDASRVSETPRWLEAIRQRLAPLMPLATRLVVTAPRYVEFSLLATIEVAAGRDSGVVKTAVEQTLRKKLALVGPEPRRPGASVTKRDLIAWIRAVDGVRSVSTLRLLQSSGADGEEIKVPRNGLPRLDLAFSTIEVRRASPGGTP